MGADVMRWQYCAAAAEPEPAVRLRPGQEIQRKLLTLWNSAAVPRPVRRHRRLHAVATPICRRPGASTPTGWRVGSRPHAPLRRRGDRRLRAATSPSTSCGRSSPFVDDLSNWYIRRSRRRFWNGDEAALRTLWVSLVQSLRVVVAGACRSSPSTCGSGSWRPCARTRRARCSSPAGRGRAAADDAAARRRGRRAQGRRARPPGPCRRQAPTAPAAAHARRRRRRRALDAHVEEIADELRVKEVAFGPVEATELNVRPNLKCSARASAATSPRCARRSTRATSSCCPTAASASPGYELAADEVLVERIEKEGWAVAARGRRDGGVRHDARRRAAPRRPGLRADPRRQRPAQGRRPGFTDRIDLTLPAADADLLAYAEWIAAETLAVTLAAAGDTIAIERV